jgi:hypothetical protein
MSNGNVDNKDGNCKYRATNLHHVFVAFLFSLVAAEIARSAATLFQVMERGLTVNQLAPGTHLFLALLVITTSWVGWSKSALAPDTDPLTDIFQDKFVMLLMDVMLVVLYFTLARTVELDPNTPDLVLLSAFQEAVLISVIFFTYMIWDVHHDVWMELGKSNTRGFRGFWTLKSLKMVVVHTAASSISFICTLITLIIYMGHPHRNEVFAVYAADVALLALIMGFRALKGVEVSLKKCVGFEVTESESKLHLGWERRVVLYGFTFSFGISALWFSSAC